MIPLFETPPFAEILAIWKNAEASRREAVWNQLPGDYAEYVEAAEKPPSSLAALDAASKALLALDTMRAQDQACWEALAETRHAHKIVRSRTICFLIHKAFDKDEPHRVWAIRAWGAILEDAPSKVDVGVYLSDLLTSASASIRCAATEAIWQAAAVEALPKLREALSVETEQHARATMAHVIYILDRRSAAPRLDDQREDEPRQRDSADNADGR